MLASHDRIVELACVLRGVVRFLLGAGALVVVPDSGVAVVLTVTVLVACVPPQALTPHAATAAAIAHLNRN
jgi:hypothetical protein